MVVHQVSSTSSFAPLRDQILMLQIDAKVWLIPRTSKPASTGNGGRSISRQPAIALLLKIFMQKAMMGQYEVDAASSAFPEPLILLYHQMGRLGA